VKTSRSALVVCSRSRREELDRKGRVVTIVVSSQPRQVVFDGPLGLVELVVGDAKERQLTIVEDGVSSHDDRQLKLPVLNI